MSAAKRIAVAGATGRVGRHIVDVLRERGHEVVPMSRALGVDLIGGQGLAGALAGAECVIDAATGPSPEQEAATAFFTAAARNLEREGERAGVGLIVGISIIGIDRFAGGYQAAKVEHERALLAGPIPARVLRAAQFHEFVGQLVDWGTQGEVAYVPRMRTQLVAARAVAEVAADLALAPANGAGPIWEVAGPREERLAEMAALLVSRRGGSPRIEEAGPADPDGALYAKGVLLPGPDAILAGPTFREWLDGRPGGGPAA